MMPTREQQERNFEYLKADSKASVNDLSESQGVNQAVIRRDLDQMHKLGIIQRFHGGATLAKRAEPEFPVVQRNAKEANEKSSIAKVCAALIKDCETVFIGSGTTPLQVAHYLTDRSDLTVIRWYAAPDRIIFHRVPGRADLNRAAPPKGNYGYPCD